MKDRFLLIRLGAFGDVIHTLPLAAAIRDACPNAFLCWAVEPGPSVLLQDNPDVDEILLLDTRDWRTNILRKGLLALCRDIQGLSKIRADVAIDAQGLVKSGAISWCSGAGMRVGFEHRACREAMNVMFTNIWAEPPSRPHHVVEKNLSLLNPIGIPIPETDAVRFPLPETREEAEGAVGYFNKKGLADGHLVLAVHPGAGWITKRWGEDRYATLADAWVGMTEGKVLLTWGPGEEVAAENVASMMKNPSLVAPPTTFREMAAFLRRCHVFAGGDTGPLHLASALGIPCLAIIGPTDPVRNGPWGEGHAVMHRKIACSGCYGRTCPDIECLDRVEVAEAARELGRLWENHVKD